MMDANENDMVEKERIIQKDHFSEEDVEFVGVSISFGCVLTDGHMYGFSTLLYFRCLFKAEVYLLGKK